MSGETATAGRAAAAGNQLGAPRGVTPGDAYDPFAASEDRAAVEDLLVCATHDGYVVLRLL